MIEQKKKPTVDLQTLMYLTDPKELCEETEEPGKCGDRVYQTIQQIQQDPESWQRWQHVVAFRKHYIPKENEFDDNDWEEAGVIAEDIISSQQSSSPLSRQQLISPSSWWETLVAWTYDHFNMLSKRLQAMDLAFPDGNTVISFRGSITNDDHGFIANFGKNSQPSHTTKSYELAGGIKFLCHTKEKIYLRSRIPQPGGHVVVFIRDRNIQQFELIYPTYPDYQNNLNFFDPGYHRIFNYVFDIAGTFDFLVVFSENNWHIPPLQTTAISDEEAWETRLTQQVLENIHNNSFVLLSTIVA